MTQLRGKVYILGAGPGSSAWLTVSGQSLLSTAEVVIYDALIDPQLLRLTPKTCIHCFVGKRGDGPSTSQAAINKLLVQYCQQGKIVVRLKSGDPFIFGRIAAEVQALQSANCDFEVCPGLSSALTVPLLAGIPLTDPDLSRSITIVSAHDPDQLDWELMVRSESLVLMMGGRSLSTVIQSLQQRGKSVHTPIAIILWGGWPQQRVWTGTLATIIEKTAGESLSPSIIVIGEVVRLREALQIPATQIPATQVLLPNLQSSDQNSDGFSVMEQPHQSSNNSALPLKGQSILVTRSANQAPAFRQSLEAQGATVLEMAALEIGPPSSWALLDAAIAQLSDFDWLILTSANGVDYFMDRLQARGKDTRALAGLKIAVVGRKTASSLKQYGLTPDFIPPNYIADALVAHFPEPNLKGIRCLFPRVESGGREVLVQELTAQGAEVTEVPAYQSQCPKTIAPEILQALQTQMVDVITFASSKTVEHFWQLLGQHPPTLEANTLDWSTLLKPVKFASIGPQTSQTCEKCLGRVDIEAQDYTLEGLTQSIIQAYCPQS